MKKILYYLFVIGLASQLYSCKKFTDITPKGKNLLRTVSDLETILNFNYTLNGYVFAGSPEARASAENAFSFEDITLLTNDTYASFKDMVAETQVPVKTLDYTYITGDESVNRAALTSTDVRYSKIYFIINNVANVVIKNADKAAGDRVKANQLKAEAYVIRAWMHYLLVNIYAKAYNPATATSDPGIPYVKEDNSMTEPNTKSTVGEVYANIIADLDMAFQLNGLPKINVNNMRAGQGFAYAAKARVFLSMHKFNEAMDAANQSLAINNVINDNRKYEPVGTSPLAHPEASSPEELFYVSAGSPFFKTVSLEIINNFYESGDIIKDYTAAYSDYDFTGVPGALNWEAYEFNVNSAGLNTSDTFLIKAECLIRAGGAQNIASAMQIINDLRKRRIHPQKYVPLGATSIANAMVILKKFSRIEFLFTVKNFLNIKRWNTEDAYKETINRAIGGVTYQLKPESKLWIFPFPQNATSYNANLTQNY